jgi:hypothetical protein
MPAITADLVSARYMVDEVEAAVDFHATHFGFTVRSAALPAFADVKPAPGRWNRIHFIVFDLPAEVTLLRAAGVAFRNDIASGPGGQQILLEDPSGNPVELFQPAGR